MQHLVPARSQSDSQQLQHPRPSSVCSAFFWTTKKKLIPCTLSFCFLKPLRNNSSGTHAEFSTSVTTLLNGNATSDYFFDILQCCHSPELPVAHALRYSRLPSFFPESLLILLADAHHDYNLRKFQPMAALDECWYVHVILPGSKGGGFHARYFSCLQYATVRSGGMLLQFHFSGSNLVSEVRTC